MQDKNGTELFIGDEIECAHGASVAEYGMRGTVEYDHEGDMIGIRLEDGMAIDEMAWMWLKGSAIVPPATYILKRWASAWQYNATDGAPYEEMADAESAAISLSESGDVWGVFALDRDGWAHAVAIDGHLFNAGVVGISMIEVEVISGREVFIG